MVKEVRVALIGAGFIGRTHALAINAVNQIFSDLPLRYQGKILCDVDEGRGRKIADDFGFASFTRDWRTAVDEAEVVVVAVPSLHHATIVERALSQGKPVLCEKPVGLSSAEAHALAILAEKGRVVTGAGFTYLSAPAIRHAKQVLDSGMLGRPTHFYGRHFEDYLSDPQAPFSWRLDASIAGRCGALGDLGCHIVSIARYLLGPISSLSGSIKTVHEQRRLQGGEGSNALRAVENEDYASAILRFDRGVPGIIEVSRIANGRKMDVAFEVNCENGSIRVEGERLNELQVYVKDKQNKNNGFRRILMGPEHPEYGNFLPAPGHGLGFNDLKTIEHRAFLRAISGEESECVSLMTAAKIGKVCEEIIRSSDTGTWSTDPERFE